MSIISYHKVCAACSDSGTDSREIWQISAVKQEDTAVSVTETGIPVCAYETHILFATDLVIIAMHLRTHPDALEHRTYYIFVRCLPFDYVWCTGLDGLGSLQEVEG